MAEPTESKKMKSTPMERPANRKNLTRSSARSQPSALDLSEHLRSHGIHPTQQRIRVIKVLVDSHAHLSAEEIHGLVRVQTPKIGLATIYRTLHALKEKGLVEEHRFNDEFSRYEAKPASHHDHLICLECGKVVEFDQPVIEQLQLAAARENHFSIVSHRLEIYGVCESCTKKHPARPY
jgi:Fur family ferric uptake transcriptional regulator